MGDLLGWPQVSGMATGLCAAGGPALPWITAGNALQLLETVWVRAGGWSLAGGWQ